MFDIATRPSQVQQGASFGVPFDWCLLSPLPATAYPWTDYQAPDGQPASYVEQLQTFALELEPTLQTAILHSLFTDRRAGRDDLLPRGVVDRRGWVGDEFMSPDDAWGSHLWLLWHGKSTADLLERARFAAQEALAWMVRTEVASLVVVTAEWVGTNGERLAIRPQIYQPERQTPVYDVLWGTTITRGTS